jgi:hypothetical protein
MPLLEWQLVQPLLLPELTIPRLSSNGPELPAKQLKLNVRRDKPGRLRHRLKCNIDEMLVQSQGPFRRILQQLRGTCDG